jgi:hypothetical protein
MGRIMKYEGKNSGPGEKMGGKMKSGNVTSTPTMGKGK